MTAMMAYNATALASAKEVVNDVTDIATAAGTNLSGLVSCLINVRPNQTVRMRHLFEQVLGQHVPALTVVEMTGEYDGMFDFSLSCTAPNDDTRLPPLGSCVP